ncbi:MAG: hypothetical protein ACRD9R_23230 [Pyrinomonadaceae bacterium]
MFGSLTRRRASRPLTGREEQLARKVFADTLPYERIRVVSFYLPGNDVPVTLTLSPSRRRAAYKIYWGDREIFERGAEACGEKARAHLIHELTHVWQGHNARGAAQGFMLKSFFAQGYHGARDILETRGWLGWARHRARAYDYAHKLGRPWHSLNVEQQAELVAGWFREWQRRGLDDALEPTDDERYAYIARHVREGRP